MILVTLSSFFLTDETRLSELGDDAHRIPCVSIVDESLGVTDIIIELWKEELG